MAKSIPAAFRAHQFTKGSAPKAAAPKAPKAAKPAAPVPQVLNAAPAMQSKSNAEGNRASLHFANMKNLGKGY